MSLITNVVLIAPIFEGTEIPGLTDPLPFDDDRHQRLERMNTGMAGGTKVFCDSIYAAAFNYVSPFDLRDWLATLPWGWRQPIIFIDLEGDEAVHRLVSGEWVELPLPPPRGVLR